MRRFVLALAFVVALAGQARAQFTVGWNQAWIEGKWARDLSSGYSEEDWRRVLRRTRSGGGKVLRVWLFEDRTLEGVVWADVHRPAGLDPVFLANVRKLRDLAIVEGVKIYWTATDGNWFWEKRGVEHERVWNIVNDKYGYGRAFRQNCLGPVVDVLRERPEATWAFDVTNEIEGLVKHWFFPDAWTGARRYVQATASFLHGRFPGLRVTSSAGHGEAAADILAGRFDGLGLDFLDVHVYTDALRIPRGAELVAHARRRGTTILLGEFGQSKSAIDPAFQARQTREIPADARRLGFSGVLFWRVEDQQPDGKKFSFYDGALERPAVEEVRRFVRSLPR